MDDINIKLSADIQDLLTKFNTVDATTARLTNQIKSLEAELAKMGKQPASVPPGLQQTKGLIEDIEAEIKKWSELQKKATNVDDITKYNRKIAEAQQNLKDYQTRGLKPVQQSISQTSLLFGQLKNQIAGAFAIGAVVSFARRAVIAYNEQLKAEQQLTAALGTRADAAEELIELSDELRQKTAIDDATILSVESFLASQGRSVKQIKQMTEAALDLSVVLGVDVNSAVKMLDQTFEGTIGRLGKYDEKLGKLSKEELKNGAAVDLLAEKYKGMAEKSATALDKFTSGFDELVEGVGEGLTDVATAVVGIGQWVLNGFEIIDEEQSEFLSDIKYTAKESMAMLRSFAKVYTAMAEQQANEGAASVALQEKAQQALIGAYEIELAQIPTLTALQKELTNQQAIAAKGYELKTSAALTASEKIKAIEKEIADRTAAGAEDETETAEETAKKLKEIADKKAEALLKRQQEQDEMLMSLIKDDLEKQYAAQVMAYNKQLTLYEGDAEMLELALEVHLQKMAEIRDEAAKKATEDELKMQAEKDALLLELIDDDLEKRFAEQVTWYNEQQELYKDNAEMLELIEEVHIKKMDALRAEANAEAIQAEEDKAKSITEINKKLVKDVADNFKEQLIGEIASSSADILGSVFEKQIQERQQAAEAQFNKQQSDLEQQKERGLITEEYYAKKSEEIEAAKQKRLNAIKLQQAKNERTLALFRIAVDTGATVMKTGAEVGLSGLLPLLPFIAAIAALQTATVLAQPLPKFKQGGKVEGRSHEQGGQLVEAEGGEWFINRNSSAKYDTVLAELNKDNSFGAIRELAKLNGVTLDMNIKRDLDAKEAFIAKQEVSLKEVPELREMLRIMKQSGVVVERGNGYRIERFGNVERKINEA